VFWTFRIPLYVDSFVLSRGANYTDLTTIEAFFVQFTQKCSQFLWQHSGRERDIKLYTYAMHQSIAQSQFSWVWVL